MAILKLEPGNPLTLHIKAVRDVDGKFGPQVAFDAENGDTLFIGADTARRQLDRIGVTESSAVGMSLLFEKVAKDGKTYWNINPARQSSGAKQGGGGGVGKSAASNGGGAPAGRVAPRPLAPLYTQCLSSAKGIVQAQLGKAATASDVLSAAATLFIAATKGNTPLFEEEEKHEALEDRDDDLPFD